MRIEDRFVMGVEHTVVRLERGIDFQTYDLGKQPINMFQISEQKLDELAKQHGFDECLRCNKVTSVNQRYVTATFIKDLGKVEVK